MFSAVLKKPQFALIICECMYFGVRHGCVTYLMFALILTPVFVNRRIGSSSNTLYSGGPNNGRIKKSFFFVCSESNMNFSPFDILVLPFDSIEIESDASGSMILTLTPCGGPVTLKTSGFAKL